MADSPKVEFLFPEKLRWECQKCGKCCTSLLTYHVQPTANMRVMQSHLPHPENLPVMSIFEVRMLSGELKKPILAFSQIPGIQFDETENIVMDVSFTPKYEMGNYTHCLFFNPESELCTIHDIKPIGCRLYPFGDFSLLYSVSKDEVVIGVDFHCRGIGKGNIVDLKKIQDYILQLRDLTFQSIDFWLDKKISSKPVFEFRNRNRRNPTSDEMIRLLDLTRFL